jgi:diguanylate cyclase (GGDEF)-like protein
MFDMAGSEAPEAALDVVASDDAPEIAPPDVRGQGGLLRRALDVRRGLAARRIARENDSALAFGVRMFAAVALAFALLGALAYVLVDRELEHRQIQTYAADQRADARSFEDVAGRAATPAGAFLQVDRLLDAIARRPGTLEAVLVDQRHVVVATGGARAGVGAGRAAGVRAVGGGVAAAVGGGITTTSGANAPAAGGGRLIGTADADPRIEAALEHGSSYAGCEADPTKDRDNFEFVTPVELSGARYAYEVIYSHSTYDAQLHDVRRVLLLVGLLALLGGVAVFYLVGGRVLLRDHRRALQRATRDGLTDLPNQRAFQDELPQAVAAAARYHDPLALAVLDVDDFKFVNDRHGHPHGDAVLRRVAQVLREARPGDRPYRIGGDEFALLLAHTDSEGARTLARRLGRSFADAGVEVSIGVSSLRAGGSESAAAGLAGTPGADTPGAQTPGAQTLRVETLRADTLRAEADAALYEAKRQGGGRSAHFEDIRGRVAVTSTAQKEAVRALLEQGRLETVFQPIWDFTAERLLGVEALMHPGPASGLGSAAEAFDVAEQLGRVHQLDVLCVHSALRAVGELDEGVLLFINLSPQTLDLDAARGDWVRAAVEDAGLAPGRVVIEVTERFGGRTAAVVKCMSRLREQGFKTALDNVGTGNSGLEMLRRLDADFVKLDPSIVIAAPTDPSARAVLLAMATFARQTGSFVIAEGVEDEETLRFLRSIDVADLHVEEIIQGGQGGELGVPSAVVPAGGAQNRERV